MDYENKYPVLYYDLETEDRDRVDEILKQLGDYFQRENVPFLFLPKKLITLEYLTKDEALTLLKEIVKEVEKWD